MADTLATYSLIIAFTAVMAAAILFMVRLAQENTRKADVSMEFHNVQHVQHMATFGNGDDVDVTYIVPKERNLWEKLTRHVGVWAWKCHFNQFDEIRLCKFYVSIPTSTYFYMQLKGWTETPDKELAQKAMDYMKWEREIP